MLTLEYKFEVEVVMKGASAKMLKFYDLVKKGKDVEVFIMFNDSDVQEALGDAKVLHSAAVYARTTLKMAEAQGNAEKIASCNNILSVLEPLEMAAKSEAALEEQLKSSQRRIEAEFVVQVNQGSPVAVKNMLEVYQERIGTEVLGDALKTAKASLNELERSFSSSEAKAKVDKVAKLQSKLAAVEPGDEVQLAKAEKFIKDNAGLIRMAEVAEDFRKVITVLEGEQKSRTKAIKLESKSFVDLTQSGRSATRPKESLDLRALKKQSEDKRESPEVQLRKMVTSKDNMTPEGQAENLKKIKKLLSDSGENINMEEKKKAYKYADKNGYDSIKAELAKHVAKQEKSDHVTAVKGSRSTAIEVS